MKNISNMPVSTMDDLRVALSNYQEWQQSVDMLIGEGISYESYCSNQFPRTMALIKILKEVKARLANPKHGAIILDLGDSISEDADLADRARLLTVVIGTQLGETVTKRIDIVNPFVSVYHQREKTEGSYIGNARSNNRPGIHTDGSTLLDVRVDVVGLLCVRPAETGGESILVNAANIFAMLPEDLQSKFLSEKFYRQDPYDPDHKEMAHRPIFEHFGTELCPDIGLRYHRTRIEGGHNKARHPLSGDQIGLLDTLDQLLYDSRHQTKFKLTSGQLLLINNLILCHDRETFQDSTESPRLLERYWAGAKYENLTYSG